MALERRSRSCVKRGSRKGLKVFIDPVRWCKEETSASILVLLIFCWKFVWCITFIDGRKEGTYLWINCGEMLALFNEFSGRDDRGNNSGDCYRERRHAARRGADSWMNWRHGGEWALNPCANFCHVVFGSGRLNYVI